MQVTCSSVYFSYDFKPLISNLSVTVESGEHIWLAGNSGCGKSSFLKLIAGILQPTSGVITTNQGSLSQLSEENKRRFRQKNIGYVHQENHLIQHWTVEQNIRLICKEKSELIKTIEDLNLNKNTLSKVASTLSGGEKQRVSLARLVLQKPALALIDEPTAHLDNSNTQLVIQMISHKLRKSTVVIVSHDFRMQQFAYKKVDFKEINK